jgi:hypothetical protein
MNELVEFYNSVNEQRAKASTKQLYELVYGEGYLELSLVLT